MNMCIVVGSLGADCVLNSKNGRDFVTFRVADNRRYQDSDGVTHEQSQWYDCVLSGKPAVSQWLTKGRLVLVVGTVSTRVFSSAKDHCMKAGLNLSVSRVELLGDAPDVVPKKLVDDAGSLVDVFKFFAVDGFVSTSLKSRDGRTFDVDGHGFVTPHSDAEEP